MGGGVPLMPATPVPTGEVPTTPTRVALVPSTPASAPSARRPFESREYARTPTPDALAPSIAWVATEVASSALPSPSLVNCRAAVGSGAARAVTESA